jgi:hypothetical protein
MRGNTIWSGEYSQCVNIAQEDWIGKYCYLSIENVPLLDGYKTFFVNLKFNQNIYIRKLIIKINFKIYRSMECVGQTNAIHQIFLK